MTHVIETMGGQFSGEDRDVRSGDVERHTFINEIDGPNGKRSSIEVLLSNKRPINGEGELEKSGGGFGAVYAVDMQLADDAEGRKYLFALKEYGKAEEAQKSLQNHRMAKKAGLRVWNTYRMSGDGRSILMSTENPDRGGWKIVGTNVLSEQERGEFFPIADFESFLRNYYAEAEKAARQGIRIQGDVPLFRIRTNEVDFVLGDMDQLEESRGDKDELLKNNLQSMHSRFVVFSEDSVGNEGSEMEAYIAQSKAYIRERFGVSVDRYVSSDSDS